jgi:hypothetical protein
MSSLEDYKKKLEVIKAIEIDRLFSPRIPVDTYLQEAENLYKWSLEDKDALVARGLSWELVEDIQVRTGALREAESNWSRERFSHEEAEKAWLKESPLAYDLRDELLHHLRFAFRADTALLGRLNDIAEGAGHADMIQDLNDLSGLGKANPEYLAKINFDMALLDRAADTAKKMASLLGETTRDRNDYSEIKKIRDQAYTHLKEAVDEVYGFGQYVFWHNEERLRGYRSNYKRQQRVRKASKQQETTPTTPATNTTGTVTPANPATQAAPAEKTAAPTPAANNAG